jgi:hypothetical protein
LEVPQTTRGIDIERVPPGLGQKLIIAGAGHWIPAGTRGQVSGALNGDQ